MLSTLTRLIQAHKEDHQHAIVALMKTAPPNVEYFRTNIRIVDTCSLTFLATYDHTIPDTGERCGYTSHTITVSLQEGNGSGMIIITDCYDMLDEDLDRVTQEELGDIACVHLREQMNEWLSSIVYTC